MVFLGKILKIFSMTIFMLLLFLLAGFLLPLPDTGQWEISAAEASGTKPLDDLPIGTKVVDPSWQWEFRTGENYSFTGVTKPVTWIVVAKDHYGAGSGVTLLSEELIGIHAFDNSTNRGSSEGSNNWGDSGTPDASHGLRKFLNGSSYTGSDVNNYDPSFYDSMSAGFRNGILPTTLPNLIWNTGSSYMTHDNVFIPSTTELGDTEHIFTYPIGTTYPHFAGAANADRIAQFADNNWYYWTRSPDSHEIGEVRVVYGSGAFTQIIARYPRIGVRPALNLQSDTLVSDAPNTDGVYELWAEVPLQSFPDVPPSYQFYAYIEAIYAAGITTGYGDGEYKPNNLVSRGQMAAFLARAFLGAE